MPRQLILFPCSHMGNLLIALPHLQAMLRAREEALLVVNQRYQALVEQSLPGEQRLLYYPEADLARHHSLLHRVRSYLQFVLSMRRFAADVAVDIEGEQKSATLTRLSGAAERIGPPRKHHRWFYTHSPEVHWSGHRWQGYGSLSRPAAPAPAGYLPLTPSDAGNEEIAPFVAVPSSHLLLIHPGATKTYKMWHAEQFAALCQRARRAGLTPVLIGAGQKDRLQIARIQEFLPEPVEDLCDRLSLAGLIALFCQARGFVGNDSGPMHLAAACGLPVVALFGPTNDDLWQPLSPRARILRWQRCHATCERNSCALDSYPCLQRITVDRVMDTLEELGVLPSADTSSVKQVRIS